MGGARSTNEERRVLYSVLWGNMSERDHLEDRHSWEDNIKMNLLEMQCGDMDWICLTLG